jgi:plasmid stabilization system protein ParE
LEKILDAPLLHPVWRPDRPYRRASLSRFPYVIFFRADAEVVQVVAIAHAKRRPGYWLERIA